MNFSKELSAIRVILFLVFNLMVFSFAMAQEKTQKTIKITGYAIGHYKPDQATVTMNVTAVNKDYEKAVDELSEKNDKIRKELFKGGFEKDELKTTNFTISRKYRYDNTSRKQIFEGYIAQHMLLMILPVDNEKLNKTLFAMTESMSEADFNVTFGLKDQEKALQKLMKKAAMDAKTKAEALAETTGIRLGEIIEINYSTTPFTPSPRPYRIEMMQENVMADRTAKTFDDVEPSDIKIENKIYMVWSIQ